MRILTFITFLLISLSIVLFSSGCGSDDHQKIGDCTDFTSNEQQCRLNFVFLEADHQSCCKAWLKSDFNQ